MKILYAIQGTGNGHLSRARDIIPILQKKGELDILVSGIQADVQLPYEVKYRFKGLSFIFGKSGGVSLMETYKKSDIRHLLTEISELPVDDYDLVINDFEPVSSWACKMAGKPCIGLSHQSAVISKASPRPRKPDPVGSTILKRYAPVSSYAGFHFERYDENTFTPVIREQIRYAKTSNKGHYTVYLPSYSDERIIEVLSEVPVKWEVFSKHSKEAYTEDNVQVRPVENDTFIKSMLSCAGILCGAGFETPAEALFLKKKLMVIPMKAQYEQQCNAAALKNMGIPVIRSLKKKRLEDLLDWVEQDQLIEVDYPDMTEKIIDDLIAANSVVVRTEERTEGTRWKIKKMKKAMLGKLINKIAD